MDDEQIEGLEFPEADEAPNAEQQEEMLPKSRVTELLKKAKLKGRDQMQEQLDQLMKENESLKSQKMCIRDRYTDWADSKSFLQKIFVERVFDPTLCGFDPLARESHKGDGKYCFEIFPRSAEEAAEEFGKEILSNANFTRTEGQFSWSYYNQQEKIILFCEFFKNLSLIHI